MSLSGHHDHSTYIQYLGLSPDLKEAVMDLMKYRQQMIIQVTQQTEIENELNNAIESINECELLSRY